MNAFNLRMNKWDIIVIIVGVITTLSLAAKGIYLQEDYLYGCAFMTGLATSIYAKYADIQANL